MSENKGFLELNINMEPGEYPNELLNDTKQLRSELNKLNVQEVDLVKKKGSPDDKAIETIVLGSLVVKLAPVILPTLVGALNSWLNRHNDRTLKLTLGKETLEMRSVSSKEQEAVLQEFIRRHQADTVNR